TTKGCRQRWHSSTIWPWARTSIYLRPPLVHSPYSDQFIWVVDCGGRPSISLENLSRSRVPVSCPPSRPAPAAAVNAKRSRVSRLASAFVSRPILSRPIHRCPKVAFRVPDHCFVPLKSRGSGKYSLSGKAPKTKLKL